MDNLTRDGGLVKKGDVGKSRRAITIPKRLVAGRNDGSKPFVCVCQIEGLG